MGFRNPITTATAVDTGQPAGAGARLYESSSGTAVAGVLEFRDGIPGDLPATVSAQANLIPQGGGGYSQEGGGMTLSSGTYNGVVSPLRLMLNVERGAAGFQTRARISQGFEPVATGFPTWRTGWRDFPGGGAFERARFTLQADGSVLFAGIIQNVTGASQGGIGSDVWIGTIPAGFVPVTTCLLDGIGQSGVRYRVDVNPDGTVHMGDSPALVSGGYLNFRGEYRLDSTPT